MPSLLLILLLALGAGVVVGELRHQQQDRAVEQRAGSVAVIGLTLIGGNVTPALQVELRVRVDNRSPQDVRLREVSVPGTTLVSEPTDLMLAPGDDTLVPLYATFRCTGDGASLTFPEPLTLQVAVRTNDGRDRTSTRTVPPTRKGVTKGLAADLDKSCGVLPRDTPPNVLPAAVKDTAPGTVRVPLTVRNQARGLQRVLGLTTESGRPVTLLRAGQPVGDPVQLPPRTAAGEAPAVTLAGEYVCGPPPGPVRLLLRYDTGPGTPALVADVLDFTVNSPGTTSSCG